MQQRSERAAPGRRARRGRRLRWWWAIPGLGLLLLQVVFASDVLRFAQSLRGYSERAWPSLRVDWQLFRHVEPALARGDPDAALASLHAIDDDARLFEDRLAPVRVRAHLARDDVPRALESYAALQALGRDDALPPWAHDVLRPRLAGRAAGPSALAFAEITGRAGVEFTHHQRGAGRIDALYQAMGSGLALVDLDGDAVLDLLLLGGMQAGEGPSPGNRLYRGLGDGRFADVTTGSGLANAGFAYGVAAADLTGDGLPELYVTTYGANRLYRNLGGLRFEDVAGAAGVAGDGGASTGAAFADMDGDGDLDLYVSQWVELPDRREDRVIRLLFAERSRLSLFAPHMYTPARNQLFRNEGGARLQFRDVTVEAGVADPTGRGLGVVFTDFDGDGAPDLFVANDESPNRYFRGRGDGRFDDVSAATRLLDARAGMGVAVADLDDDAALDLVYTNFRTEYNAAVLNRLDEGYFAEQTQAYGLSAGSLGRTSWGVAVEDFDNDRDVDLATVNGHPTPFDPELTPFRGALAESPTCLPESPLLYERRGSRYVDVTSGSGDFGRLVTVGRGLVAGDIDRDGRLDLVVSANNGAARLYRNASGSAGHWLVVRPRGDAPNASAVGATVAVSSGGTTQHRRILSGGSYLSQAPLEAHFGLGDATRVDSLRVRWPDGRETRIDDLAADAVVEVRPPAVRADAPRR